MIYGASLGDLWSIDIDNESFTSIYAFNAATDGNVTGSLINLISYQWCSCNYMLLVRLIAKRDVTRNSRRLNSR